MSYELLARRFIRHASKKLGLEGRLSSFEGLINEYNKVGRCVSSDVLLEYVDSLFMKVLGNVDQLAFGYRVDDKVEYYLRRYLKSNDLRGFVKYVLGSENYAEVDAINNDNMWAVPIWFGFNPGICPAGGGTCASSPTSPCVTSFKNNVGNNVCCTSEYIYNFTTNFTMQDTVPYKTTYDCGFIRLYVQLPSSPGTFTINGSFSAPSCFPTSGVSLNLDLDVAPYVTAGTCASSCPSNSACTSQTVYYCGSSGSSYTSNYDPVFYYSVGLLAFPNSNYSVWVQYSTS